MIGALVWFREPLAKAAGGAFGLDVNVSNPANLDGAQLSASTLNYMSPGAGTTTATVFTGGTDTLQVNIFGVASTVATTDLRWTIEYSHSTSSVPSEQLWFPEPQYLEANRNGIGGFGTTTPLVRSTKEYAYRPVSTLPHRLATSTAMDSTFTINTTFATSFKIENIAARWTRVVFYIPTAGATLAESTALDQIPVATSTNAAIYVHTVAKNPL